MGARRRLRETCAGILACASDSGTGFLAGRASLCRAVEWPPIRLSSTHSAVAHCLSMAAKSTRGAAARRTQTPATASTPSTGGGIVVPAQQGWTSTGIAVRRGEWITFNTTGQIRLTTDAADVAGAAGSPANRTAANAPLPGTPIGALIGRVGNSTPFVIGNQTRVQMPAAGVLFVGINDDHLADNDGEFRVEIQGGRVR